MLSRISIGWGWLEKTLNAIIDAINVNQPIGSATIAIEQSPNGTLLRVVNQKDPPQPGGSAGGGGAQQPVVWHNVGWVTVTIVDPATCAQTQLNVLAQKSGSVTIS